MPTALVEVRRSYTPDAEVAIMNAVHAALVATFNVPETGRNVRFVEHAPHRMVRGAEAGVADTYTRVTIDCFPGRTDDMKRALYRDVTERLGAIGIPAGDVAVLVREASPINWGDEGFATLERSGT